MVVEEESLLLHCPEQPISCPQLVQSTLSHCVVADLMRRDHTEKLAATSRPPIAVQTVYYSVLSDR